MKEYKHPLYQSINKRILANRKSIQIITGPRQVGKTTLIRQILENVKIPSTYTSGDAYEGDSQVWLEKLWNAVRIKCGQEKAGEHILAIDEIQKIPGWSQTVKKLWDEDTFTKKRIKVIISGSSSLLLQKGLNESLAGRFEMNHMNHWSFSEMREAFGWTAEEYVWFGGYPGSEGLIRDEHRWKKYISESLVETSISKDILMLTRVDKPALMKRLYDLGCLYSGQILSYTKMLGQLQDAGNTVTLAHYLELLNSAGLLAGIEKYSGSIIRQRSSSPKFIVRNTALLSSRTEETMDQILKKPEKWGRFVESSVGAHILNNSVKGKYSLYYWRQGNDEIDFVLKKNEDVIGLEIKSGHSAKRSGMDAFSRIYKPHKVLLVGDKGISWEEFLSMDPEGLF
jgi:predicted AAA+ superfamily ATPase